MIQFRYEVVELWKLFVCLVAGHDWGKWRKNKRAKHQTLKLGYVNLDWIRICQRCGTLEAHPEDEE